MATTIIGFVLLIALSGFFSGVEIAFFSLSPAQVRTLVRQGLRGAKTIERLKANPQRLLSVVLVGNNLVNIFAAALATEFALEAFGSFGIGIATGMVTLLVLIFGEIFPKSFAQVHARSIARYTARPLLALEYAIWPVVFVFEKFGEAITRITSGSAHPLQMIEEEIRSMFHLGVEQGVVEAHEQEFVGRLFRFNDAPVRTIVTKLKDVVMLEADAVIEQVAYFVAQSGYSRFPVFEGSRKNIVGTVHVKDILRANNSEHREEAVVSLAQAPVFVSEDEKLDDVFRAMRAKTMPSIMFTRNRKGRVTGIITLEDLLEELVGEIYDESDRRKMSVVS